MPVCPEIVTIDFVYYSMDCCKLDTVVKLAQAVDRCRGKRSAQWEDNLIRERRQLAVRRDMVDCDYYRMLEGDVEAINAYGGVYMAEYSWAELTTGRLQFQRQ